MPSRFPWVSGHCRFPISDCRLGIRSRLAAAGQRTRLGHGLVEELDGFGGILGLRQGFAAQLLLEGVHHIDDAGEILAEAVVEVLADAALLLKPVKVDAGLDHDRRAQHGQDQQKQPPPHGAGQQPAMHPERHDLSPGHPPYGGQPARGRVPDGSGQKRPISHYHAPPDESQGQCAPA